MVATLSSLGAVVERAVGLEGASESQIGASLLMIQS